MNDGPSYISRVRSFDRNGRLYILSDILSAFYFGIYNVIFNLYILEIGFGEDFLGLLLSAGMFGTAAVALLAGMVSDRYSRRRIIFIAGTVNLVCTLVLSVATNGLILILAELAFGVAGAFFYVAWLPYITGLTTDDERAHLFSVNSGLSLLAVFFGNLVGGFLPGLLSRLLGTGSSMVIPFRYTLLLCVVFFGLSIVVIVPMGPDRSSLTQVQSFGLGNVRNWRFLKRYTASVVTIGLGAGMIVQFFNIFFSAEETFGASTELIGIIFGLNTLVLATGNFVAPVLSDRLGKVRTVAVTELLSIPFLLLIAWSPVLEVAVFAYVMRSALMNMAGPVVQAFFMEQLAEEERSTASGLLTSADSVARGVASNIGGTLLAMGLYRLPYVIVSGLYLLGVAQFYYFFRHEERRGAYPEVDVVVVSEPETGTDIT